MLSLTGPHWRDAGLVAIAIQELTDFSLQPFGNAVLRGARRGGDARRRAKGPV